jgi:hypothetical protein
MWARPVMPELPSFYYRRNCFSAFMEDHVTLPRAEELNNEVTAQDPQFRADFVCICQTPPNGLDARLHGHDRIRASGSVIPAQAGI